MTGPAIPRPPHRYEVGKPYNPNRKIWPHGSQFNWMNGELDLYAVL